MLCYVMLCCDILCYLMFCYDMLGCALPTRPGLGASNACINSTSPKHQIMTLLLALASLSNIPVDPVGLDWQSIPLEKPTASVVRGAASKGPGLNPSSRISSAGKPET